MLKACRARSWPILPVVLLLAFGAAPASPQDAAYQAESTARMVRRLELMRERVRQNPRIDEVANGERARLLQTTRAPTDPAGQGNHRAALAEELLRAGRTGEAIEILEGLRDYVRSAPDAFPENYDLAIVDTLAIAHFRKAIQAHCIGQPSADGCIVPIVAGGVLGETEELARAIEGFERTLESTPDDLGTIWLLNVAYMMQGHYPKAVPAQWLIPPAVFQSDYDITPFRDIGTSLGVATLGHAGGSIIEDFDEDGFLDIMASGRGSTDQLRYFRNTGDGAFEERTRQAGLQGLVRGLNLIHGDYDNDGFEDVYVLRGGWEVLGYPNSLLRNNGDGTFDDVTEAAGLLTPIPSQTAAFADYDNDGDLDLYVGNESSGTAGVNPSQLYENQGDGTFTDVALQAGVDVVGFVKAVIWGDYDNDGRQDLYVSVLRGRNRLFRNEGPDAQGRWGFLDLAGRAGVAGPANSFPIWFWDYDNDGWLDLFVSGYDGGAGDMAAEVLGLASSAEMPRLYRNNRNGTFSDVAAEMNLATMMLTMGSNYGDLDNDGWLDFYVGTGDPQFRTFIPNRVFRNAEGNTFQDVTSSGRFGMLHKGHGVSFGDLDHDGDQDLHITLGGAYEGDIFQNALLENPGHGNHWLTLHLEGTRSNRSAIGARIRVGVTTADGAPRTIHRVVTSGGSFGASTLRQEIGLGRATAITFVEVTWPATGIVQRFEAIAMDRAYSIREDRDQAERLSYERITLNSP